MADTPTYAPTKSGIVPYLAIDGAVKAAELYQKAFGAELAAMVPPDEQGRTMHIHLYINDASLMLADFYPEQGHAKVAPAGFSITVQLADGIQTWWDRAVAAGLQVQMPLADMFWGDRYGSLQDQFGVTWALNQPGPK